MGQDTGLLIAIVLNTVTVWIAEINCVLAAPPINFDIFLFELFL